ncbi:replication restart helicase PriA [Butyrivibrio sp. AE2032]|uniref:replication restart helicase PriA n=1 Tax=Butyrivibrio sp. AE2032 TaxID=1458463 RepID=UPI00054D543B|nr:primosomal protein N' [Butyrivibrio sp. AE2032]
MYCGVILRGAVRQTDRLYTYHVPEELEGSVLPGSMVSVPFGMGDTQKTAVVIELKDSFDGDLAKIKDIGSLMSSLPVLNGDQIAMIGNISERFNCTRGEVVELMVPSCVVNHKDPMEVFVELISEQTANDVLDSEKLRSAAHINILEYLLERGKCTRKELMTSLSCSAAQVKALEDKGLVRLVKETAEEDASAVAEDEVLQDKFTEEYDLAPEQQEAVDEICNGIDSRTAGTFLLFGITGSGKTEVYLNCAKKVIADGGSVIYLVPEISLTPQTISWIKGRLGDSVAVLHSRLTDKQRYEQWNNIRTGRAKVIVGPRSGVFAPAVDLRLIILDEEHDSSYKSESHPRYSAKDIARLRSQKTGCTVVLGSATPSVESFYAAQKNAYKLLELKNRARQEAVLPEIIPVDMKEQIKLGSGDMLSLPLRQAMSVAFSENKQAILLLNRRGFSRTLICEDCGEPVTCKNCSVAMTLHNSRRNGTQSLICHYCGYTLPSYEARCSYCGGNHFTKAGFGTQQLEEFLHQVFPHEKVLRMDQDSTMTPGAHKEIIEKFANKEASILIGTQMIAKGLDFPDCTVVGVLGADLMLASSSFKASERAFQLITQAAGRAGRGDHPGIVFIQSYRPDQPLFRFACSQDYRAFYDQEIEYRKKLNLPPFKAVGEIVLSLTDEDKLIQRANILAKYLNDFLSFQDPKYQFEVYGPIPCVIYELRGRYRMSFVIKSVNKSAINSVFKRLIADFDHVKYPMSFDNDPQEG